MFEYWRFLEALCCTYTLLVKVKALSVWSYYFPHLFFCWCCFDFVQVRYCRSFWTIWLWVLIRRFLTGIIGIILKQTNHWAGLKCQKPAGRKDLMRKTCLTFSQTNTVTRDIFNCCLTQAWMCAELLCYKHKPRHLKWVTQCRQLLECGMIIYNIAPVFKKRKWKKIKKNK